MRMWGRRHLSDEELSLLLDGRLDDKERRRVEAHLRECGRCREAYEDLRRTVALLQQAPRAVPPRAFTLSEADVQPVRRGWSDERPRGSLLSWATAFVGLVLVALLGIQTYLLLGDMGAGSHEYSSYFYEATDVVSVQSTTPEVSIVQQERVRKVSPEMAVKEASTPAPMIARAPTQHTPQVVTVTTTVPAEKKATVERVVMPALPAARAPQAPHTSRSALKPWLLVLDATLGVLFLFLLGLFITRKRKP